MKISLLPTWIVTAVVFGLGFHYEPAWANGCAAPNFAAAQFCNIAAGISSIATGDFNGDGKLDLAGISGGTNIVVLLGNGDGTFQPPINIAAGANACSLEVGDFDHDGKLDVAVADYAGDNLTIFLGNGDGTFRNFTNYSTLQINNELSNPTTLAAADFNHDGNLDLAMANAAWQGGAALVFLGNGDGTFRPPATYGSGVAFNYRGDSSPALCNVVAIGDINGDGAPDLILGNWGNQAPGGGSASVSVLFGNGDGTFQPPAITRTLGLEPGSFALGDFTGNGKLDLAVASRKAGDPTPFLLGNGDGTFQVGASQFEGAATSPYCTAVGDFNSDGKLDLAVLDSQSSSNVLVLFGNGDGTFQTPTSFNVGAVAQSLAVGDFNGDGKPDLAVATASGVAVLLNACPCAGLRLNMAHLNGNLVLSWPLPYTNFVLECAPNPTSANWQPVAGLLTNNGCCEVTVPANQTQGFFRLRKQ